MEMTSFYNALMFRAHSFPRKFSQASSQNFAAHHGKIVQILRLTMVFYLCINLSFILFKKLQFLDAGMVLSYASNMQRKLSFFSFQKCNLSISCIMLIYDCAVYDGNY